MRYLSFYVQLFLFLVITILGTAQVAGASTPLDARQDHGHHDHCRQHCSEYHPPSNLHRPNILYHFGNFENLCKKRRQTLFFLTLL